MTLWLIRLSLRYRFAVVVLALTLVILGIRSAFLLPMDALPDITSLEMQINTPVEALAPEEVEKQITVPLERTMAGLPRLKQMRSMSKYGLSQITLIFDDEAPDAFHLHSMITERIQGAMDLLPAGLQPEVPQVSSGLGEIYYYQVAYRADARNRPADKTEALVQLKIEQNYTVAPSLMEVPGVAEVSTTGGFVNQVVVEPDPVKLSNAGIGLEDLAAVIRQNTSNSGGGAIQKGGQQIIVRSISRVQSAEEIGNLAVRYGGSSRPIYIHDVAEIKDEPAPRVGAALVDGEEAVIGAVIMVRGENTRTVTGAVREKMREIQSRLPEGIGLVSLYDRGELISSTIGTIEHNLFMGAMLVTLVLFAFLGNWRAAGIVALAIPLSLLGAIIGMKELAITGNLISLGAIDFGLLVDGAVVMVENILRHMSHRQARVGRPLQENERMECIESACAEVGPYTVAGVGIITLVYLPIFALSGIEGKMFRPLAATVTMALAGALLLALTLIPALCAYALTGRMREGDPALLRRIKAFYEGVLHRVLPRVNVLMTAGALLLLGALAVFSRLGAEFIPHLDEGSTLLVFQRASSIGLDAAIEFQSSSEKLLRARFPRIQQIFSRIGADDGSVDPVGLDKTDTYLLYAPQAKVWVNKEDLESEMSDALKTAVPGQTMEFVQPIEDRFNDFMQGARADVAVKFYGDDFAVLEKLGTQAQDILGKIPGATDVVFNSFQKAPIQEIKPDRAALALYGLQADDINHALASGLAGMKLGSLVRGDRFTDIVLRYPERVRLQANQMNRFPLRLADGGVITLDKLATVDVAEQISEINRDHGRRVAVVSANIRGRDSAGFVRDLRRQVAQDIKLPDGYVIELDGQFKNLESASGQLLWIVPVVLLVIFILIYMAFRNWRQVVVIYTAIPLAATGGIFALWIRQLPFSIPAAIGFIALSGIAVLNGIVLISYFNKLRGQGWELSQAVVEGALTRLRPVLMTALVASLGLIPMALASGPGAEIQRPLATVVIGGILSSTFLTLLLLPALYARYGGEK